MCPLRLSQPPPLLRQMVREANCLLDKPSARRNLVFWNLPVKQNLDLYFQSLRSTLPLFEIYIRWPLHNLVENQYKLT